MTAGSHRILLAERFDDDVADRVRPLGEVIQLDRCDQDTLLNAIGNVDALLVRSVARVTRKLLDAAPRLRVVGRAGVGLDTVDVEACRARGIQVVYTPAASTEAVADLTLGLLLALERKIAAADEAVRRGRFVEARASAVGRELSELCIGIVGMGRIGQAVARRCRLGFGMKVLYNDPIDPGPLDFAAQSATSDELYGTADVVSLHIPLTDQTRGLIDAAALSKFKRGSLLINTARGAVIESEALIRALKNGTLGGAALDTFDPEPLPTGDPLLLAPNTILTPHIGARTPSATRRMNDVVEDVIRVLRGQAPHYPAWMP